MKKNIVKIGFNYGEHVMNPDSLIKDVDKIMKTGGNSFIIRLGMVEYPDDLFASIANYAKNKGYYFGILYSRQFPPPGKESHLDADRVKLIKEIAGDYFLGEFFGEAGSDKGAKDKGYFKEDFDCIATKMPPQNLADFADAKNYYVSFVKDLVDYNKNIGLKNNYIVEATAFFDYDVAGGISYPVLETMPYSPDRLIPFARGAAKAAGSGKWGGFIANEWYGGYFHSDDLKKKRLDIAYRLLYASGASEIYLESGNNEISSFGYKFKRNSPECASYRKSARDFFRYAQKDERPCGAPIAEVAFIHGNLDGYTGFMGSSLWSQFGKEEWGKSDAERSWDILADASSSYNWCDTENVSDISGLDVSRCAPYGTFDVIPATSPSSLMKKYKLLIFVGWNTMTAEIMENLKAFVKSGGRLIICACHLNTRTMRGDREYIKGYEDFLGGEIVGEYKRNNGIKFVPEGEDGVLYPGAADFISDCNYADGFMNVAKFVPNTAKVKAFFEDKFSPAPYSLADVAPFFTENRFGKGIVSFMANADYPAAYSVYAKYKTVIKQNLIALNKKCPLKIVADDKIKCFTYADGKDYKLYLLNTDFNLSKQVLIYFNDTVKKASVKPCDLISVRINSASE